MLYRAFRENGCPLRAGDLNRISEHGGRGLKNKSRNPIHNLTIQQACAHLRTKLKPTFRTANPSGGIPFRK